MSGNEWNTQAGVLAEVRRSLGGEHPWGHDLRYADGSRGDAGNNFFPVRYAAAYHDLMRSAGVHGVTFSRAGFTGSTAYPAHRGR